MPSSEHVKPIYITENAKQDLREIRRYTESLWGEGQRNKYMREILAGLKRLRDMPGLGIAKTEIHKDQRCHQIGKHVIYYRSTERILIIDRVLHQSRDPGLQFAENNNA